MLMNGMMAAAVLTGMGATATTVSARANGRPR